MVENNTSLTKKCEPEPPWKADEPKAGDSIVIDGDVNATIDLTELLAALELICDKIDALDFTVDLTEVLTSLEALCDKIEALDFTVEISDPVITAPCYRCVIVDGEPVADALATTQGWYQPTPAGLTLIEGTVEVPDVCDERCAPTQCEPIIDDCLGCGPCNEDLMFNTYIRAAGVAA